VVQSSKSCLPFLAADCQRQTSLVVQTSPLKTRVWNFSRQPSGRLSQRPRFRPINTPGLRGCGYKTASGRQRWLNRDPIAEHGGANLYGFVKGQSIGMVDLLGLSELSSKQYRTFIEGRLNSGERNINKLWRDALNHYLAHDPENDCVWDCEDDVEEIIEAFYNIFSSDGPFQHGQGINAGVHTGDGSSVTHFFAGAEYEGAFELGERAQDIFEIIGRRGGDWLSDTAYAYTGADFSDYFDTFTEKECRKRVKEFTTGNKTITGLWGPTPPSNTKKGLAIFRRAFRTRLGL